MLHPIQGMADDEKLSIICSLNEKNVNRSMNSSKNILMPFTCKNRF